MKKERKNDNENLFEYFRYHAKSKKKEIFIAISIMILSALVDSLGISLIVPAVNILIDFNDTNSGDLIPYIKNIFNILSIPYSLRYVLGLTAIIMLVRSVLIFSQNTYCGYLNSRYRTSSREKLLIKLNNSSWNSFKSETQTKLISLLTLEATRIGSGYVYFIQFLSNIFVAVVYLIFLIFVSYKITIFAIIVAVIITLGFSVLSKISNKLGKEQTILGLKYLALMTNYFNLSKYLRVHGKDLLLRNNLFNHQKLIHKNFKKNTINDSVLFSTYEYAFIGFLLLGLTVSTRYLDASPSSLTLMSLIFFRLFQKTRAAQQSLQLLNKNLYSHFLFNQTLNSFEDDVKWGASKFTNVTNQIHVKNISFNRGSQNIFTDASTKIKSNSTTLIVGPSGWGKTTLVDLLIGLIHPEKGEIRYDDKNLYEYDKYSFKSSIGYVDQNALMFNDTIINNLTWANPNATKKKIVEISKKLKMDSKIKSFPKGYNSQIGDLGSKLSGGEKQRLAIIRALLTNPKILILDEAFNQIDSESKIPLIKTIREMQADTTIIIITHTPDTLPLADKIIEVKNNKIKTLPKNTNWSKYFGAEGESRTRTP